eukprot:gene35228-41528_t
MSVFADNQVPAQPVLHAIEQALESPDFVGDLTMQSEKVKRCLAANGEVYAVIDPVTNGFAEMVGYDNQVFSVPLYNARGQHKTLDTNGFELVTPSTPFPAHIDLTNDVDIMSQYYPLIADCVRHPLSAYKVVT